MAAILKAKEITRAHQRTCASWAFASDILKMERDQQKLLFELPTNFYGSTTFSSRIRSWKIKKRKAKVGIESLAWRTSEI